MSKFYDIYWTRKDLLQSNDFSYKFPAIQKYIPQKPNLQILDFGCGNGLLIKHMLKINPKSKYTGIDVSKKIISVNKKMMKKIHFFHVDDGEKFPIKKNSFDFIISTDVIEHVYNTEFTVLELIRVLKPGGKLLITTPYHGTLKNIVISLTSFEIIFDPTGAHIRFFTKKSLTTLLKKTGLHIIKVGYYGRFFPLSRGMYVLAEK